MGNAGVLMGNFVSYTPEEVAGILKISRFTVYEMIKRGDLEGYRIGRKVRVDAPDLAFYINNAKNNAAACQAQNTNHASTLPDKQNVLIISGQDDILDMLARHLGRKLPYTRLLRSCHGSFDGLGEFYRGTVNVATTHLWDSETDSYNIPYVRRMLPGHRVLIIGLAAQATGFYVAAGNPKAIYDWQDLTKIGVRFINRERGCGIRILLDEKLRTLDINPREIIGYEQEVTSTLDVAGYVARRDADVGLGTEKVALRIKGIDFIPLQKERYDLVIRREDTDKPPFRALLSVLQSKSFQSDLSRQGGYDLRYTGKILAEL